MDKIQKEIIEIISDYMDKTLSEGCLVKMKNDYENAWIKIRKGSIVTYLSRVGFAQKDNCNLHIKGENFTQNVNWLEILGHFDITAVLKYIRDVDCIQFPIIRQCDEGLFIDEDNCKGYFLPNKPLHLYTEQENIDLLKLLKELGITKKN